MKAIVLHKNGGPEVLKYQYIATPEPGPGEVLVRVYAAGVNHVDIDIRNGISGMDGVFPHILGVDAAGDVAKVGPGVLQWKKGDRVAPHFILSCGVCKNCIAGKENICLSFGILGATSWGTYAQYVTVGAHHLVSIPDKLDYDQAVSAYVPFATAWEALIEVGKLQAGENVLINAASSGVGSAAIQIAKLAGARVITTSSSTQKLARAKKLGADVGINYRTQNIGTQAQKATGGLGVDIALEMVGGETLKQTIDALAPGGRIVTVGAHGGEQVDFDMIEFFRKHISMHGCGRSTRAMARHVLELTAAKKLKPVIHKRFALKDAAEAHQLMESRKFFGRMVLNP